jgi:hypothetical protein
MTLERVQACFPKCANLLDPDRRVAQRLEIEITDVVATLNFAPDETGAFQNYQVLRYSVQGDREVLCDIGDPRGIVSKVLQDSPARRIGYRSKHVVERRCGMMNHMVEHTAFLGACQNQSPMN